MAFKSLAAAIAMSMVFSVSANIKVAKKPVTNTNKVADNGAVKAAAKVGVVGFDTVSSDSKITAAVASSAKVAASGTLQKAAAEEVWAPQDPTEGNSLSGAFVAVVSLLMFALIPLLIVAFVLVMTSARHALLSAGIISSDSEIAKLGLKAQGITGPLASQFMKLGLVQQALASMGVGFLSNPYQDDAEKGWGAFNKESLINESDGEDEEDAEVLSRPMGNVAERKPNDDLIDFGSSAQQEAPVPEIQVHIPQQVKIDDLIDFGSSPQQEAPVPEIQGKIGHHQASFVADDFFDEDDF